MKTLLVFPFAMIFAALTETQTGVVLAGLVFMVLLLGAATLDILRRLSKLEKTTTESAEKTTQEYIEAVELGSESR